MAQPSAFLDRLPRELRDEIYRLLLVRNPGTYKACKCNDYMREKMVHFNPSLLLVCKQVYAEAARVFYHENTFRLGTVDVVRLSRAPFEMEGTKVVSPVGQMKKVFII
jgi:hypothetical protein